MIKDNLNRIRAKIQKAAQRARRGDNAVRCIVVTKEADPEQISEVLSNGICEFGENRVKEAILKAKAIGSRANWHLIGHLQTNKVRDAVRFFTLIHSIDSIRLARKINEEAEKIGKVQAVLIEVNVSGEWTKFGVTPDEVERFLNTTRELKNIKVNGLMTMAPYSNDPEKSRPYFKRLRELSEGLGLGELSMGMTQDYEVAVEEGATMVRIGRAVFRDS